MLSSVTSGGSNANASVSTSTSSSASESGTSAGGSSRTAASSEPDPLRRFAFAAITAPAYRPGHPGLTRNNR